MNKLVKNFMTDHVLIIHPNTPFTEACRRFKLFNVHHLPVVDDKGQIVGMLTAIDALEAYNTKQFNRIFIEEKSINEVIKVEAIMTDYQIYTIQPNETILKALELFEQHKVHALPVVEDGKLVGILTSNDIIKEMNAIVTID